MKNEINKIYEEEIEINKICEECSLPLENNVTLENCIGKTIKFAKTTSVRTNNVILFVFTDNAFLILKNSFDYISDIITYGLGHDDNYQNLMIDGGLISQEKVDKFNKFWKDREQNQEKERDFRILKSLLAKYPDFENK